MMHNVLKKTIACFIICFFFIITSGAEKPIKVVSLSPNLTELVCKLGKSKLLVGRSSACDYPESVKQLPVIGDYAVPSMEKLISVSPDIVISSTLKDKNIQKTIENMGIKFILLSTESIDNYLKSVEIIGKTLNCREQAKKEIERIKSGLKKYKHLLKTSNPKRLRVYLEIWDKPIMTVGKHSFINDFITYAGGENIAGKLNKGYFACQNEWIIKSAPEVIICPSMNSGRTAEVLKRTGWTDIPAIKQGHVYTGLNDDVIFRLGPRMLEGIEEIHKCILKSQLQKSE